MSDELEPFGFGPVWARDSGCCGKPVGCTNLTEACRMRSHWWKRKYAGVPETADGPRDGAEEGHAGAAG